MEGFMITEQAVETTCSEVGTYTDEQMVGEFERFFRSQPAVCEFVFEVTEESGQEIQELSLFLSYMVFKTMETSESGIATVKPEDIEAAYRGTESWITRLSGTEGMHLQNAVLQSLEEEPEPYLLQYVISELNEPVEDGTGLKEEEKGEVFFVLRTVISSFCTAGQ
jgi:hypothetical protein